MWLRMVGADGAVHETNLTAQAAANSKAELALVKAEEAKAELKQERARRDALQWTHDRDERGPGYELAREKGMREAAMKAEGEAKARRNSEIKARKEEEERRMAAESALADALEELKASKSRTAVAERALADEQKARGSLAERCEQRGATVAETAASLKGAQRELGDVRRAAEAATLEAERAHAQVHEMQLQTEQLQATVETLETRRRELQTELKQHLPLAARKPPEQLAKAQRDKRRLAARKQLGKALDHPDLRMADISKTLAATLNMEKLMDTKVRSASSVAASTARHTRRALAALP